MSFLLTGQTDSGKSTISGNLLYSVGYFSNLSEEDQRYYRKYLDQVDDVNNKSRFSVLMDLLDGEILANKSKTVDFNICSFSTCNKNYNLIDTPGHKLYIRSLINGLFHVKLDLVCLVVSSLTNEFNESLDRGTIKEDLMLSRSTGCTNLLIVWNKSDINKPDKQMETKLQSFLHKLSFKKVDHIQVCAYKKEDVLKILSYVKTDTTEICDRDSRGALLQGDRAAHSELRDKFTTEGMMFTDELISPGYRLMAHSKTGEVELEIVKIKNIKTQKVVRFIKESGPVQLLFQLEEPIIMPKGTRLIFRSSEATLGFGVVG
jgi:GTPase